MDHDDFDPGTPLGSPVSERQTGGLGLATLPQRLLITYPILFMLPFPLTLLTLWTRIPGLEESFLATAIQAVVGLHGQLMEPVIGAVGVWLTGEELSFEFTGSGDGLASYVGVLVDGILAILLAVGWWLWRRSTPISPEVKDLTRVLIRYFLAWIMFSYGFSKLFPLQFAPPGPDRLLQPYGDSSPMGLLWTFMGASAGYQMFSGAAELLGGVLLLFRRTTLLGSLVVAAVMTNVFALNLFYDVPVKLYSFHYLLLALILALPDAPRLYGLFIANTAVPARYQRAPWAGSPRLRKALLAVKGVLILLLVVTNTMSRLDRMEANREAMDHPLRGVYGVESFAFQDVSEPVEALESEGASGPVEASESDGALAPDGEVSVGASEDASSEIADVDRWTRVGLRPPYAGTVQRADGTAVRMRMRVDMDASTLALFDRGVSEPPENPMRFEQPEDGVLVLEGLFNGRQIQVTLRREEAESLLTSRGFHWVSEYPFNR